MADVRRTIRVQTPSLRPGFTREFVGTPLGANIMGAAIGIEFEISDGRGTVRNGIELSLAGARAFRAALDDAIVTTERVMRKAGK